MKLKIISQGNHNSQLLTLNSQQKKEMIQDYQIQEFLRQAHRVGDAGLTLCSSGNISWRIGDEALVSGTGSWVPTLPKEKVAVCRVADGEVLNGVKPSMRMATCCPVWLKADSMMFLNLTARELSGRTVIPYSVSRV